MTSNVSHAIARTLPRRPVPLAFLAVVWLLLSGGGFLWLERYAFSKAPEGRPAARWPDVAGLRHLQGRPALVLLAHPRCPCTRASLAELRELMARSKGRLAASVLFYRPGDFPAGWEKTDLWRSAAEIPGVSVLADEDGALARAFGGLTSGHCLLYDAGGHLLFSGGITLGRGHPGENPGRAAILSHVLRGAGPADAPVFGCPIERSTGAEQSGPVPQRRSSVRGESPAVGSNIFDAAGAWGRALRITEAEKSRQLLECGGRAKRRHRFQWRAGAHLQTTLPRQSKAPSPLRSAGALQKLRAMRLPDSFAAPRFRGSTRYTPLQEDILSRS